TQPLSVNGKPHLVKDRPIAVSLVDLVETDQRAKIRGRRDIHLMRESDSGRLNSTGSLVVASASIVRSSSSRHCTPLWSAAKSANQFQESPSWPPAPRCI